MKKITYNWPLEVLIIVAFALSYLLIKIVYPNPLYSTLNSYLPTIVSGSFLIEVAIRFFVKKGSRIVDNRLFKYSSHITLIFLANILTFSVLFEKWFGTTPSQYSIYNGHFTQGGYLPYSDAFSYLSGVLTFREFNEIFNTNLHRPLGTFFFSAIYGISDNDLQLFFIVSTALLAASFYFVSSVILKSYGFSAAILSLMLLIYYSSSFIGSFLTEIPGLIFGCLSFTLIWNGVLNKKIIVFSLGIFGLAIAMNIRAGVIILPFIIFLFSGFIFNNGKFYDIKSLAIVFPFLLLGTYSTNLLLSCLESKITVADNSSDMLYQLSVGGDHWSVSRQQHPEVFKTGELHEQYNKIKDIAYQNIKKTPTIFLNSLINLYRKVLQEPLLFYYHFNLGINKFFVICLLWIGIIGGLLFSKNIYERWLYGILIAATVCTFMLAPLLEETRTRVYASTILFNCAWLLVGIGSIMRFVQWLRHKMSQQRTSDDQLHSTNKPSAVKLSGAKKKKNLNYVKEKPVPTNTNNSFLISRIRRLSIYEKLNVDESKFLPSTFLMQALLIALVALIFFQAIWIDRFTEPAPIKMLTKSASGLNCSTDSIQVIFRVNSSPAVTFVAEQSPLRPKMQNVETFVSNSPRGITPQVGHSLVVATNLLDKSCGLYYFTQDISTVKSGYIIACAQKIVGEGNPLYICNVQKLIEE